MLLLLLFDAVVWCRGWCGVVGVGGGDVVVTAAVAKQ